MFYIESQRNWHVLKENFSLSHKIAAATAKSENVCIIIGVGIVLRLGGLVRYFYDMVATASTVLKGKVTIIKEELYTCISSQPAFRIWN